MPAHPSLSIRRNLTALLAAVLLALPAAAQPSHSMSLPETVKAARWKQRVLVLCAPAADNASLQRQRQLLAADQPGLQERDMLVLDALEPTLSDAEKRYVRQTLGVPAGTFAAVLIGKDGGVKRRDTAPVTTKTLFGTIDVMPMRRDEMRRQKK